MVVSDCWYTKDIGVVGAGLIRTPLVFVIKTCFWGKFKRKMKVCQSRKCYKIWNIGFIKSLEGIWEIVTGGNR